MSNTYVNAWILRKENSDACVVLPRNPCGIGNDIEKIQNGGNWTKAIAIYVSNECFSAINGPGSKVEIMAAMREFPGAQDTMNYLESAL